MRGDKDGIKDTTWIIVTVSCIMFGLCLIAGVTVYIDPLFHFHPPLMDYEYPINNERYQNDGIVRNFEYDGIITGTSMTENFMTSEADQIFAANFIKVPFSGGTYREINDNLRRAYDAGQNIRYVIRDLNYGGMMQNKDAYREDAEYPTYLYNNNLLDDVNYILNKSILLDYTRQVIKYTDAGNRTTSFDVYVNWNGGVIFGRDNVLKSYTLGEKAKAAQSLSEEAKEVLLENIRQNVTDLAYEHPETIFYLFFPPYSICYWDVLKNDGLIDQYIEAEEITIEEILQCPNIKLYSFRTNFELVCDLENYKDQAHYGQWVNSWMLERMYADEYLLTEENYQDYINKIREFYKSYDYEQLHK